MITPSAVAHRVYGPPAHYALLNTPGGRAARAFAGGVCTDDGRAVRADVGGGGDQPAPAAPTRRSATELVEVTEQNRLVADPPRFLVARDQVNQGAAVLMMSIRPRANSVWRKTSGYSCTATRKPLMCRFSIAQTSVSPQRRRQRCTAPWRRRVSGSATST